MTISSDRTDHPIIVIGTDASPSEHYAAEELQRFVEEICGVRLTIHTDGRPVDGPMILLGGSPALRSIAPDVDRSDLGDEGYILRTVGPHLILFGGRKRGSLYAVYGLLEDHLGCRWFTSTLSCIPKRSEIVLDGLDERRMPVLEYRDPYVTEAFDGTWSARNRMNASAAHLEPKHGGRTVYAGFVHTFNSLVPPEEYFDAHPEYFSEINGERTCERAQLCLTNPDVLRIATENVRAWLRANPEATIVSVSQNDWHGACTCAACSALAEKEESESGPLLHFVNAVADAIKDEFPHVAVDTLAYQYTRKPPKFVRPLPNVIIRLCTIECCFVHPLSTGPCPQNARFREDVVGWHRICDRLYVWDYVTDFRHYLLPFPNLRVIPDNIRFFVAHGVKGIFEEGPYGQAVGTESAGLRSYLMAKCLWDPDCDADAAMDEFLRAVYGPAYGPVRRYYDRLHNHVEAHQDVHVGCFEAPETYLTHDLMDRADALFDEAERCAGKDEAFLKRLRLARLPILYARIALDRQRFEQGEDLSPADWTRWEGWIGRFEAEARTLSVVQVREGGSERMTEDWLAALPRRAPDS